MVKPSREFRCTYLNPNMDNFIHVDFFKKKCTTVLGKCLYVLYLFCGAICYENFARFKLRCFVVAYLSVVYIFCTIILLKDLFRYSDLESNFTVLGYLSFLNQITAIVCLYYWKKNDFGRLLDAIDKNSDEPIPCTIKDSKAEENCLKETDLLKLFHWQLYSFLSMHLLLYLSKISIKLIFYEMPFEVSDEKSEFFIPLFCATCNTTLSYAFAYNSSFLVFCPLPTFCAGTICLFISVSVYLKNRAISLINDIKCYSDAAFDRFEDYDRLEELELKRIRPSQAQLRDITQQRVREVQEFKNKIHQSIRIHQRLVEYTSQYQKCWKIILDVLVGVAWISVINLGYFCQNFALNDGNFLHQYYFFLMGHLNILLICCAVGNLVVNTSENISDVIYSTPWYYLPAKDQKDILNYLTLAQRTHTLKVFGIFSVCLEFVPMSLKEAYGYIQIMHLLVTRSKN